MRAGASGSSNPIDAFRPADQRLYVDWLRGLPAGDAALAHAPRAVLVRLDGEADRRLRADRDFRRVGSDPRAVLYERVGGRDVAQAASCQASTATSFALGSARTCSGRERRWWLSTSSSNE